MIVTHTNRTPTPPTQAGATQIMHGYLPCSSPTILPHAQTLLQLKEHLPLPLLPSALLLPGH